MYTLKFINFPFLTTKGNRGMKMRQVMAGRLRPCVQHGSWRGVESRLRAERSPRLVITGGRMRVDSKSFRPFSGETDVFGESFGFSAGPPGQTSSMIDPGNGWVMVATRIARRATWT